MKTKTKALWTIVFSIVMFFALVCGTLWTTVGDAYQEGPTAEGNDELETTINDYTPPVGLTMQRLEGSGITETDNLGDDLLFVIKQADRYYAMKDIAPADELNAIPAVDVTDWIGDDGVLTVPQDTKGVAFWRYEEKTEYTYGLFINGTQKYLEYSYDYESVDGDSDYYNDAERTYSGEFSVKTYNDGNYIHTPYYRSVNEVSGTIYFVEWWDQKIGYNNYIKHSARVIVDLRSDANGGKEFYFRYLGTDVEYTGEEVEGYLYHNNCRHQYTVRHAEYDAPTCMLKGCEEYWYCEGCNQYGKDENFTQYYGAEMPVIPALGHDWGNEDCANCHRKLPVYSKVTTQEQFNALGEDTMYVIVAEYEGKYYTPDLAETYLYIIDSNNDGFKDIYDIDENNNGVSDMFEKDGDGNGVYDYLEQDYNGDEIIDKEDWIIYHEDLCWGYLSDKIYGSNTVIPVKEIQINTDGTISHAQVTGGVEFEMVDLYLDEEIDSMMQELEYAEEDRYSYESVKQFVIPNMFIGAPSMLPTERGYKERVLQVGDTYSWGVLFANNAEDYTYCDDYETMSRLPVPLHSSSQQDTAIIFSTFDSYWFYGERQLGPMRLRDYNGELSFVVGPDYELEGWESYYNEETEEWEYNTNDTQVGVYLYASEAIGTHTHEWSAWTDNGDGTHSRTCTADGCSIGRETNNHTFGAGVVTQEANCTQVGITTYTCSICRATKKEETPMLNHNFGEWVDDGETADTHSKTCQFNCGEKVTQSHNWGDWEQNETGHSKSCPACGATREGEHNFNDGVVVEPPTHTETGIKTYTCQTCGYYYDEEVPALTEHEYGEWIPNDDNTHSRYCVCQESQTEDCVWDEGVVTERPTHYETGIKTYTCTTCGNTYDEEVPVLTDHEYGEWIPNDDNTHSRYCVCQESQTEDCVWDEGVVTERPTHYETGIKTYTCTTCGNTYDEEVPVLTEHEYGEWLPNDNNTHSRYCVCQESQTEDCVWDEGVEVESPTHAVKVMQYTCTVCGNTYYEEIPNEDASSSEEVSSSDEEISSSEEASSSDEEISSSEEASSSDEEISSSEEVSSSDEEISSSEEVSSSDEEISSSEEQEEGGCNSSMSAISAMSAMILFGFAGFVLIKRKQF